MVWRHNCGVLWCKYTCTDFEQRFVCFDSWYLQCTPYSYLYFYWNTFIILLCIWSSNCLLLDMDTYNSCFGICLGRIFIKLDYAEAELWTWTHDLSLWFIPLSISTRNNTYTLVNFILLKRSFNKFKNLTFYIIITFIFKFTYFSVLSLLVLVVCFWNEMIDL